MKDTKERILLKALLYFTENDYEGASLNKIAKSIGITKGGIYHYFSSKDELFHDTIVFMLDALEQISMEMVDPDVSLEELVYGLFSFDELFSVLASMFQIDLLKDYFNFSYLMFAGIKKFPDLKKRVAGLYAAIGEETEKILKRFQSKGEISRYLDCRVLSFQLSSMMEGAMLIAGLNKSVDLKTMGKSMAESVMLMVKN